jgi:uncharacterized membrane protein YozB (DUF420 family)
MDPKLWFWTAALALMGGVVACAAVGIARRRRGEMRGHRSAMLAAAALVGLFLLSYLLKVALLGHEEISTWSEGDRLTLWIHEGCVAVMLGSGAMGGWRAWRLRRTRNATLDPRDPVAPVRLARWHRRAGWTATVAAGAGWLTALLVLVGMYRRAGLL